MLNQQYENIQTLPKLITDQRLLTQSKFFQSRKSKEYFPDRKSNISALAEKLQNNWRQNKPVESKDEDDSLTNLTWLHNITSILAPPESPNSNMPADSSINDISNSNNNASQMYNCCEVNSNNYSSFSHLDCALKDGGLLDPLVRYDYKTNWSGKPPFSYATLICMAMRELNKTKITLSDIYNWITDNFIYYRLSDSSWQNSVRHNLSLNKCFEKVPRGKDEKGKGGFWRINPKYADRLESNLIKYRRQFPVYNGSGSSSCGNNNNINNSPSNNNGTIRSYQSNATVSANHNQSRGLPAAATLLANKRQCNSPQQHNNNTIDYNNDDLSSCQTPSSDYSTKISSNFSVYSKTKSTSSQLYLPNLPIVQSLGTSLSSAASSALAPNSLQQHHHKQLNHNCSSPIPSVHSIKRDENGGGSSSISTNSSSSALYRVLNYYPHRVQHRQHHTKLMRQHPIYHLQSLQQFRTAEHGQKVDTQLRNTTSNSTNSSVAPSNSTQQHFNDPDHPSTQTIYSLLVSNQQQQQTLPISSSASHVSLSGSLMLNNNSNSNGHTKQKLYKAEAGDDDEDDNEDSNHILSPGAGAVSMVVTGCSSSSTHQSYDDIDSAASSSFDADLINPSTHSTNTTVSGGGGRGRGDTDLSQGHNVLDDDDEDDDDDDVDDDDAQKSISFKFPVNLLHDEFISEPDDDCYLLRSNNIINNSSSSIIANPLHHNDYNCNLLFESVNGHFL